MLSMAERYAECGSSASPPSQQRHPPNSRKPSPFRILLLGISRHLGKDDMENLKAFVEDYGEDDDKGFLTVKQLQEVTTMYKLLTATAKVHFIRPDDLSNLVTFLDRCGHHVLVVKIQDYQKREQNEAGLSGHLEHVGCSLRRSSLHPSAEKQPGDEHSEQQRHPPNSRKPSPFRILLLDISQHLGKEDMENFKAFVEDNGEDDDKGFLTVKQLQEATTMYSLLMKSAKVRFIQPDDLSNLVAFLESSGHRVLVGKILDYQKREQNLPLLTFEAGLSAHLEYVGCSLRLSSFHPATDEQPGDEHSEQSSDPSLHTKVNPEQPTDDAFKLSIAPLGARGRQQKIIPYFLLNVCQLSIPIKLQEAMKGIVIGHYVDVFRCIYSYFESVIKRYSRTFLEPFTGFSDRDGITLEFGLGTVQHLPIQALKHPAFRDSDDYECILQLIMEAILIAPNPKKNLDKFLTYPNLDIPKSLQLLYRSRLPSVATDEELRDELASLSQHLTYSLRGEQQQANFAAGKNALYLAHVYDATAYINRHQMRMDSRSVSDYHEQALEERLKYEPRTDLEKVILKLESAQSQGYTYAEMAINGLERPGVLREDDEKV